MCCQEISQPQSQYNHVSLLIWFLSIELLEAVVISRCSSSPKLNIEVLQSLNQSLLCHLCFLLSPSQTSTMPSATATVPSKTLHKNREKSKCVYINYKSKLMKNKMNKRNGIYNLWMSL
eukprot:278862_1